MPNHAQADRLEEGGGQPAAAPAAAAAVASPVESNSAFTSSLDGSPTPVPDAARACGPGELVADRFRVVRLLGRGGSGEVYEAVDQHLGSRVALKVLRPPVAAGAGAASRLRREVLLARQVTHPNVLRVFDAFQHRLSPERADSPTLPVVAMELVAGSSLAQELRDHGPMAPEVALPILAQVAAGLDAAHEAGVVHRDLKSANVLLAPGRTSPRALVTDFGLAMAVGEETGSLAGTVPYVAPEVLAGEGAGPASDVYAFGVLGLEVLTGGRPRATADRLADGAELEALLATLPRRWSRVLRRCLAPAPERRYRRAGEAVADLQGRPWAGRRGPTERAAWLAAAISVVGIAGALAWLAGREGRESLAPASQRPTLGLVPLADLSGGGEGRGLAAGMEELLAAELAAGNRLLVRSVADAGAAWEAPSAAGVEEEVGAIRRLAEALDCDAMLWGALRAGAEAGGHEVELRLTSREADSPVSVIRRAFSSEESLAVVAEIGEEVRGLLRVAPLRRGERLPLAGLTPHSELALRRYGLGLSRLSSGEFGQARRHFQEALAEDPAFSLAHAGLAEVAFEAGEARAAAEHAGQALAGARGLPRERRLEIEALERTARGDFQGAAEIYRALWTFFPDNLNYGLQLGEAQVAAADAAGAERTLAALRPATRGRINQARVELFEARVAGLAPDLERRRVAAERALAGLGDDAPMLEARARRELGTALRELGDPKGAERELSAALALSRRLGSSGDTAAALNGLGRTALALGDHARAEAHYAEAQQLLELSGSVGGRASVLQNRAVLAYLRGDLEAAERLNLESHAAWQAAGDQRRMASTLNNLGLLARDRGRHAAAASYYEESLALARGSGNREAMAQALSNLGELYWSLGEPERSRRAARESARIAGEVGLAFGVAVGHVSAATFALADRDLRRAREELEAALRLARQMGEPNLEAEVLMARGDTARLAGDLDLAGADLETARGLLAGSGNELSAPTLDRLRVVLALRRGAATEALRLATEAVRPCQGGGLPVECARLLLVEAEAAAEAGERRRAAAALLAARERLAAIDSVELAVLAQLAEARLLLLEGHSSRATEMLSSLAARAAGAGYTETYFDSSLLLVRSLVEAGRDDEARVRAASLEAESLRAGFGSLPPRLAAVLAGAAANQPRGLSDPRGDSVGDPTTL